MVFYLSEPNEREAKPDFSAIPNHVKKEIEALIEDKITDHKIAWGGYSPTFSSVVRTKNGHEFFIKGTHPDHTAHGYKVLMQEIHVYKTCKSLQLITPVFIGSVHTEDEDSWHLGVWKAIKGAHLRRKLTDNEIDTMFNLLGKFYKSAQKEAQTLDLPQTLEANFVEGIVTGQEGWIKFKDNKDRQNNFSEMFTNKDLAEKWLVDFLPEFIKVSQAKLSKDTPHSIISFDMRVDNIVFDNKDTPYFIDWPDASVGPILYDLIYLCMNIMAESGQKAWEVLSRFSKQTGYVFNEEDIKVCLSQISGFYALQAYRPVPEKLPRLRWIQKAMLWAGLNWLENLSLCTQIPEFKE